MKSSVLFFTREDNYRSTCWSHRGTLTLRRQLAMLFADLISKSSDFDSPQMLLHSQAVSQFYCFFSHLCPFFSLRYRCFSGFHCWNAAAAHITPPSRCHYDHCLPWRDPNEDAENAYFASRCFQSGHRWVRYSNCCACCAQFVEGCLEINLHGATCCVPVN